MYEVDNIYEIYYYYLLNLDEKDNNDSQENR